MIRSKKEAALTKGPNRSSRWPFPLLFSDDLDEAGIMLRLKNAMKKNHENHMNCAERTLASICQAFELEKHTRLPDDVIRMASGFGGGGGITSYGLCGAVSGGLMALGLFWGRIDPMDYYQAVGLHTSEEVKKNPAQSKEFYRIFNCFMSRLESKFGSVICRELIRDFIDADGLFTTDAKLKKQQSRLCKRLTKWACINVMRLLLESRRNGTHNMKMGHNLYDTE